MKPLSVGLIYFFAATILALSPSLTKDLTYVDILKPYIILPAIGAGLVAVKGYLDPTIRPMRKDDAPPRANNRIPS